MARTAFIILFLVCVADLRPDWLLVRRSLLPQVHARTSVISNPHDPSLFSKTPLAISETTGQDRGPRQRRRLHRRTKLEAGITAPRTIGIMQQSPPATTSSNSALPSGSTRALIPTTTSTTTAVSGSTFISNVLQVPILPSSPPEGGNNDVNNQQNILPQPNQPPLPSSQDSYNPSLSQSSASEQGKAAALSPPSLIILSATIVAVVSLVVVGAVVAARQQRKKRWAKSTRLECIEGGQGSIASQLRTTRNGGDGGRRSWTQWFGRQRKDDHYGLHSFNSSGSNSLPEQFWNPE
ncbi:hypothetical protein BGZ73_005475 [Actinomortierella ambigua]|nr:hypothetical protein BGZ73_005475 [Actinomortierella ambigua]